MPRGTKVLMVDDDQMLIDMYKERLELAGYGVTTCYNGEEALTKIRETKPDIILLDIMMPKLDGYQTLASLKSDAETKNIPVIMLSALMRDLNREKAIEVGADDYLIKSEAMPSDVIVKIENVLGKYSQSAEPEKPQEPPHENEKPEVGMIETHPVGAVSKPTLAPIPPALEETIKPSEPPVNMETNRSRSFSWLIWVGGLLLVVVIVLIYFLFLKK